MSDSRAAIGQSLLFGAIERDGDYDSSAVLKSPRDLCVPKIRFCHIDGEGRQGQVVRRRRRGAQSRDGEGRPCSGIDGSSTHYTTRRRNAHGITEYELLYPWHPWAGCLVHIHEVVEKAGREVFRSEERRVG